MATDIKYDFDLDDIAIVNGDLVLIEGIEELRQNVVLKLKTFSREMWLSPFAGIPYLRPRPGETQQLIGKIVSLDDLAAIFENAMLEYDEIDTLEALELDYNTSTKELSVTIQATANEEAFTIEATL